MVFQDLITKPIFVAVSVVAFIAICASSLYGTDFYIDPENGSPNGDGSLGNPWQLLQEVIDSGKIESMEWESLPPDDTTPLVVKNEGAPVKAGDTIRLATGNYDRLNITGYYNTEMITVTALAGAEPRFSSVLVRASANWALKGLSISPEYADTYNRLTMIDLDSHGWHGPVRDIIIEDCALRSVEDVSNWTIDDWNELPVNGIGADGTNIIIRNNYLKNVAFGISVGASHSLIENNMVENFSGDGMRGLGDYSTFAYNTVKNCYDVNGNHDDGFQSWSVGDEGVGSGEVIGIILRGNLIINYEDPDQPFRGTLQGICCFDGMFVDWVVENNVVYTDHWHGITLLGARNSRIINNTVLDPNEERPGPPWVNIGNHKDGTEPEGCIVRNNLTTANTSSDLVTQDHNIIIDDPLSFFTDPENMDFHLLKNSAAVDAGSEDFAPELDKDKVSRPQLENTDIGAYEWH